MAFTRPFVCTPPAAFPGLRSDCLNVHVQQVFSALCWQSQVMSGWLEMEPQREAPSQQFASGCCPEGIFLKETLLSAVNIHQGLNGTESKTLI